MNSAGGPDYILPRGESRSRRFSRSSRLFAALLVLPALVLPLLPGVAPAFPVEFDAPALGFDTGSGTAQVVLGDLNLDGRPDIATRNSTNVSILLGSGSGLFNPRTDNSFGTGTLHTLALGDLNADGVLDLVVGKSGPNRIAWRLGAGDGLLGDVGQLTPGALPLDVRVVDADHDGHTDLVMLGNGTSTSVQVWRGHGDTTFFTPLTIGTSFAPLSMDIGDLNGDVYPDMVMAGFASGGYWMLIMTGQSTGRFLPGASWLVGNVGAIRPLIADVDADGLADVLLAANGALFFKGNGNATVGPGVASAPGFAAANLVAADFDGDGRVDLAGPDSVVRGNGDGTFQDPEPLHVRQGAWAAAGELTGDTRTDLVVVSAARVAYMLRGNGDATFGVFRALTLADPPHQVAVADLTGDGRPDIVATVEHDPPTGGQLALWAGLGAGTFGTPATQSLGNIPNGLALADMNDDGRLDVVSGTVDAAAAAQLLVTPGQPGGTLGTPIATATPLRTQALTVADLDDDHQRDAIIAGNGSPGALVVHWGQGDGTFVQPPLTLVAGNGTSAVATGWVNADTRLDLVSGDPVDNTLSAWLGAGSRAFGARLVTAAGGSPSALALGDFNEDGKLDVVAALTATPLPAIPRALAFYAGLGNGGFDAPLYTTVGYLPRDIRVADLDADGHLDVALANTEAATVTVLRGDGAGNFTDRIDYGTDGGAAALALADLNLDGKADMTVAALAPNGITLLLQHAAISAVPERPSSPGLALLPAWPNPARAAVTIPFRLAAPAPVQLNIYDVAGRLVARLADRAFAPGDHTLEWDGHRADGTRAPAGVYFYELATPGWRVARRLTLVR